MAASTSISPNATTNIPLRRLVISKHLTSNTPISTPPHRDNDNENNSITTSDDTSSITHSLLPHSAANITWNPTSILQIQSQGKGWFSFPIFASEPEIPILSETLEKKYLCIKPEKRSGSCYLVAAGDGNNHENGNKKEIPIARTKYTWGPFRNPVVWVVDVGRVRNQDGVVQAGNEEGDQNAEEESEESGESFEIIKKDIWNYNFYFSSPKWKGRFEWRYAGRAERKMFGKDINNLLVLEKVIPSNREGEKPDIIRIAQLIRGPETRTPGTKASDAGNGGRLKMWLQNNEGETMIDEITVVMTCLVMLKKEIDRARARQIAMMSSPGGA